MLGPATVFDNLRLSEILIISVRFELISAMLMVKVIALLILLKLEAAVILVVVELVSTITFHQVDDDLTMR